MQPLPSAGNRQPLPRAGKHVPLPSAGNKQPFLFRRRSNCYQARENKRLLPSERKHATGLKRRKTHRDQITSDWSKTLYLALICYRACCKSSSRQLLHFNFMHSLKAYNRCHKKATKLYAVICQGYDASCDVLYVLSWDIQLYLCGGPSSSSQTSLNRDSKPK